MKTKNIYGTFVLTHFIKVVFDSRVFSALESLWILQS